MHQNWPKIQMASKTGQNVQNGIESCPIFECPYIQIPDTKLSGIQLFLNFAVQIPTEFDKYTYLTNGKKLSKFR